jgi:excisionase family DNA binding protein
MSQNFQSLSVVEIAEICGVARSTVSYWIAKKSLPARRSGKKHTVFVDDLVLFLKSEGQAIPQGLLEHVGGIYAQPFRPLKRCWEYWANDPHGTKCQHCGVLTRQICECFTVKDNQNDQRPINCHECQYFGEYYGPRVAFIHQIDKPVAVYKGLYLWSGNQAWADLSGVDVHELIGVGIEEIIHPDSLKMFISYDKRRQQGDPTVPDRYQVFLSDNRGRKIKVYLSISPLIRPSGTWLAVAERTEPKS